jgi:hypothetical protein
MTIKRRSVEPDTTMDDDEDERYSQAQPTGATINSEEESQVQATQPQEQHEEELFQHTFGWSRDFDPAGERPQCRFSSCWSSRSRRRSFLASLFVGILIAINLLAKPAENSNPNSIFTTSSILPTFLSKAGSAAALDSHTRSKTEDQELAAPSESERNIDESGDIRKSQRKEKETLSITQQRQVIGTSTEGITVTMMTDDDLDYGNVDPSSYSGLPPAGTSIPPQQLPVQQQTGAQILTRAIVPSLAGTLDASDVVECYAVTRLAKLKMPPLPLSTITTDDHTFSPTAPPSTAIITDEEILEEEYEEDLADIIGGSTGNNGTRRHRTKRRHLDEGERYEDKNEEATPNVLPQAAAAGTVILIRKSALAFRFRPNPKNVEATASSFRSSSNSKPDAFSLTLEYGPQRTGLDMDSEAIPMVEGGGQMLYEDGTVGESGKFVSWQNEGKIYFETQIGEFNLVDRWETANYMAPVTGAVLSKILDYAVDYTTHYPRYQPFQVFDVHTQSPLFPSSSSDDFVWSMFDRLAGMYVDLHPLLAQPRQKLRLYVNSSLDHVEEIPVVHPSAIDDDGFEAFTSDNDSVEDGEENFNGRHNQAEEGEMDSIHKTDDSDFGPADGKDVATEEEKELEVIRIHHKVAQVVEAYSNNQAASEFLEEIYRCGYSILSGQYENVADMLDDDEDDSDEDEDLEHARTEHDQHNATTSTVTDVSSSSNNTTKMPDATNSSTEVFDYPSHTTTEHPTKKSITTTERPLATTDNDSTQNTTTIRNGTKHSSKNVTTKHHHSSNSTGSAGHTSDGGGGRHLKQYDKKTEKAKATTMMKQQIMRRDLLSSPTIQLPPKDALLSGDAQLMTDILAPCFSSKRFMHSQKQREGNVSSTASLFVSAYLFLDGANYYRVNLTWPYIRSVSLEQPLPSPKISSEGKGDMLDWTLASLIMVGFVFGVYLILLQSGIVRPSQSSVRLYSCLQNVFHMDPDHHGQDGTAGSSAPNELHDHHHNRNGYSGMPQHGFDSDQEEEDFRNGTAKLAVRGGGAPHPMAQDAIPLSMGGQHYDISNNMRTHPTASPFVSRQNPYIEGDVSSSSNGGGGAIELPFHQPSRNRNGSNDDASSQPLASVKRFSYGDAKLEEEEEDMDDFFANSSAGTGCNTPTRSRANSGGSRSSMSIVGCGSLNFDAADSSATTTGVEEELMRNHALRQESNTVALPDLKSKSRVAVPVGIAAAGKKQSHK